jgi:hypothetical protein
MPTLMINPETGEIDLIAIGDLAILRACREYGSLNPPPIYLRQATEWCQQRAQAERRAWRRDHGIPDDSSVVMMAVPEWGASGESFAR